MTGPFNDCARMGVSLLHVAISMLYVLYLVSLTCSRNSLTTTDIKHGLQ